MNILFRNESNLVGFQHYIVATTLVDDKTYCEAGDKKALPSTSRISSSIFRCHSAKRISNAELEQLRVPRAIFRPAWLPSQSALRHSSLRSRTRISSETNAKINPTERISAGAAPRVRPIGRRARLLGRNARSSPGLFAERFFRRRC